MNKQKVKQLSKLTFVAGKNYMSDSDFDELFEELWKEQLPPAQRAREALNRLRRLF